MMQTESVVEGIRTTYLAADAAGNGLTAIVVRRACIDSMSGAVFEADVTVTMDGTTFRGCGRFL